LFIVEGALQKSFEAAQDIPYLGVKLVNLRAERNSIKCSAAEYFQAETNISSQIALGHHG
jgi:hypothetical protein